MQCVVMRPRILVEASLFANPVLRGAQPLPAQCPEVSLYHRTFFSRLDAGWPLDQCGGGESDTMDALSSHLPTILAACQLPWEESQKKTLA